MLLQQKSRTVLLSLLGCGLAFHATTFAAPLRIQNTTLTQELLAQQLGWTPSDTNNCGGYYVDQSFAFPGDVSNGDAVQITSKQALVSQRGTSTFEDGVSISRSGQQITANKVFLYRDPNTFKPMTAEMIGNVNLREPNTLIVGKRGRYQFSSQEKSLMDIFYRTSLNGRQIVGAAGVSAAERQKARVISGLTAWGQADEVTQKDPRIYELKSASFSTCPPLNPAWQVKGSNIVLDKNTGRGHVTNARILVKGVPVFYFPYIDFSIDHQRKSGFLWPTVGLVNSSFGPSFITPFYWNMAPNYDMTITPSILGWRGMQLSDQFRYLSPISSGNFNISVLPSDRKFRALQEQYGQTYGNSKDDTIQAELSRLLNSSTTRKSLFFRDETRFNEHWSSHIDYNYAGDDYYLQDFGSNLNEITQNQLLQEGDLYYKAKNWNFIGRLQTYQTLHPIIEGQPAVQNQYRRFPQLILNSDYPNQKFGLEYFMISEGTHFDIRETPGTANEFPIGNRFHAQPGISLPVYFPYFYFNPRAQLALSAYQLYQVGNTGTPHAIRRVVPIMDIASGIYFTRNVSLFNQGFQQTLEPQLYYTYIPYRDQSDIPLFDTTVNTLTYDQLFNYNRFSGIDRIGDANQLGVGISSRFLDAVTSMEKVRIGAGSIVYFANRNVTLCNNNQCTDNPANHSNYQRLSPLSGLFSYHINPAWKFDANSIWNPVSKQIDNATLGLHYQPDPIRTINLGYSYVFNGDIQAGSVINSAQNNLKLTDFSFAWPIIHDFSMVGRWSEDWNLSRLQNLLSGVQYDTCCWSVRLVGGRAFTQLQNQTPQYNNEFYIQFALKGLGNIGSGNPTGLLSSINGYNTQFGQEF